MIFLSRVILDPLRRSVRRDLADCYQLHRTLLRAFPPVPDGVSAREHVGLLYRAEPYARHQRLIRVLVQSTQAPDWTLLPQDYCAPTPDDRPNPALRTIDDEYEHITVGMRLMFRLRANPTRRVSTKSVHDDACWHGKRVELRQEQAQLAWLARKGQDGGFRLLHVQAQPDVQEVHMSNLEKVRGWRPKAEDHRAMPLHFGAVLFEGRLEVTDSDRFRSTLRIGVGSGKAFGFGLLSIAAH